MLSDIMDELEKCVSGMFRGRALDVMESYKAGTITLEEASELIDRLARMEKYCALTVAAMHKTLAEEGGSK
jgi:hypothetical protein